MARKPTTTKPTTAKAAADKPADGEHTKLAQVTDPAHVTDAKIAEISGDDGSNEPENSANADVAETLQQNRAEAKAPGEDDDANRNYFHGQGGAAGL